MYNVTTNSFDMNDIAFSFILPFSLSCLSLSLSLSFSLIQSEGELTNNGNRTTSRPPMKLAKHVVVANDIDAPLTLSSLEQVCGWPQFFAMMIMFMI
jgi:hypothetical protein